MTNDSTAPERLVNTQTKEAQRVQGSVLASAAHLSTHRFQGWGNPIVASCKDAADMIGALASERDTIQSHLEAAQARIAELERRLGGGCDANNGGEHTVMSQGKYKYCSGCGESLRGVRYCHEPRAALEGKG